MSRLWVDAVGILASLGVATGGYQMQKRCRPAPEDARPGELFTIPLLLKATGEFLLCGGVLLALILAGILVTAR